jgi:hypothetical protein
MSVLALSPPGAHLSTADRPRDEAAYAQAARVPVDRVSISPFHRPSADVARPAFVHHTQHVNPTNAVDLIPVAIRNTTVGDDARRAELPKPTSASESDSAADPPTIADRALAAAGSSAVSARKVPDAPVGESSPSAGLDSPPDTPAPEPAGPDAKAKASATTTRRPSTGQLTADQALIVAQLQTRDRQVRSHEAAHQAAGGALAGAASFSYERGPDGKVYAVGGEVPIDVSGGSNPSETIAKARQIRAAALAPADPSGQDLRVAAAASAIELEATLELSLQQRTARTTTTRANHVHSSVPCATCAKASTAYKTT